MQHLRRNLVAWLFHYNRERSFAIFRMSDGDNGGLEHVRMRIVLPGQHTAPEDLLDMMERERVSFALGVPTIWTAVVNALETSPERWKLTIPAAAA